MPDLSPLAEALASLDSAMRPVSGRSNDLDRRRAAARLAELARCEDDELPAFARRHRSGRAVDEAALCAARAMLLALDRVLGPEGPSAEALDVLHDAHRALEERLADAMEATELPEAEAATEADTPVSVPAPVPVPAPAPVVASPPGSDPLAWAKEGDGTFTLPPGFNMPVLPELPFVRTPAPRLAPLSPREPAAWHVKSMPTDTLDGELPGSARPVLPFTQAASEQHPREAIASLGEKTKPEPPTTAVTYAPTGPTGPTGYFERPLVAAAPSASPAAAPGPVSSAGAMSMRSPPPLTLNQYALLIVACELYPSYVESTHALYGVTSAAARESIDAFWASRFAADPALFEQWRELCVAARNYFLNAR